NHAPTLCRQIPRCESPSSLSAPSVAALTQLFTDGPLVAVRHLRHQPLAPRSAAVEAGHFRRQRSLIDEDKTRSLERGLIGPQFLARGGDVRPILLGRVQDFFKCDLVAVVEPQTELMATASFFSRRSRSRISSSVRSGSFATKSSNHSS
ncbi:MAG: hypothetical protein J2P50_04935, partial [Hyphomicrobiaceae bacterium]|nr:hypothetical protein [Hyphomicrobiaceae bacterium]